MMMTPDQPTKKSIPNAPEKNIKSNMSNHDGLNKVKVILFPDINYEDNNSIADIEAPSTPANQTIGVNVPDAPCANRTTIQMDTFAREQVTVRLFQ